MKTSILKYNVIIQKQGKNYVADVPTLGISDFGKTIEEAKKNVQEAIECHIEGMVKTNSEVPSPDNMEFFVMQSQISINNTFPFKFAF